MINLTLIRKYSNALADSMGDSVYSAIEILGYLSECFNIEKFVYIISSPIISKYHKEELLLSIINTNNKKIINFIKLINHNNRLLAIPDIYQYLKHYINLTKKQYKLIVYSSFKLTENELEIIKSNVSSRLGVSLYVLQEYTKEEGIRIFVDDVFMEVSLFKNHLHKNIKEHILKPFN